MIIILTVIIIVCLGIIIAQNYFIMKTAKELVSIREKLQNILDMMYMDRQI